MNEINSLSKIHAAKQLNNNYLRPKKQNKIPKIIRLRLKYKRLNKKIK